MTTTIREHAIRRIRARQQFYAHLTLFAAMGAYLVYLWSRSGADFFWPAWALIGWGIGIASHGVHVFGWRTAISEERIDREVARLRE